MGKSTSEAFGAGRPFVFWVIFGIMVYVGISILVLLLGGSATGGASLTDPFILIYLSIAVLFVVAGALSLTGRRWALIFVTALTLVFLLLTIPFSLGTLTNPADPNFWILFSGVFLLVLVAFLAIAFVANVRRGIGQDHYLATPSSWAGLMTVAVVGFVVGSVVVSGMAGPLVSSILKDVGEPFDVAIVRDAALPTVAEPYSPATLTISAGETVTWFNADTMIHTVTSGTGLFDSGELRPGGRFSYTFTEPGTYSYFCIPHPWMQGTVVVQ